MSSISMASFEKNVVAQNSIAEIDPSVLDQISGGCGCEGKYVTKTDHGDGKVSYKVDEDKTV